MTTIKLKKLINEADITQLDFALATGLETELVSRLCNNKVKYIRLEHLQKICQYFRCTPNDVFTIT